MIPDPVEKLARFTPAGPDQAELLFAAGRASASTPWFWKAALAASVVANAVCVGFLVFRAPEVQRVVVPQQPAPVPVLVSLPDHELPVESRYTHGTTSTCS
jgi:predicted membrane-bound mannosyltransferase